MQRRRSFIFILGSTRDSLFVRALALCFFFDGSTCSHIICSTSVDGNSSGAGVTLAADSRLTQLISKIHTALLCLTSNKPGLKLKAH